MVGKAIEAFSFFMRGGKNGWHGGYMDVWLLPPSWKVVSSFEVGGFGGGLMALSKAKEG